MMFSCKKFSLSQENCSMKITTSALIFGALIEPIGEKFLEIGSGTGILSLMLAQRSEATIKAIEIESEAAQTSRLNFQNSPWNSRLELIEADATKWYLSENQKYNLIFSNPPFYIKHLSSKSNKNNLARHDQQQLHQNLAPLASKLLEKDGYFWILTDLSSIETLQIHFEHHQFFKAQTIYLHHRENAKAFAVVCSFIQKPVFNQIQHFYIYDSDQKYSRAYCELLKDFLLFL